VVTDPCRSWRFEFVPARLPFPENLPPGTFVIVNVAPGFLAGSYLSKNPRIWASK
jgi:hypothetical protein